MFWWGFNNHDFFYFCNGKFYKNGMIYGWDGGIPIADY